MLLHEPGHRPLIDQSARPQHSDVVADALDIGEEVAGEDDGDRLPQPGDEVQYFGAPLRIGI
ncbi:hypothetical protein HDA32_005697 [Spinactinospora alkalitolerans]|uniref:Uncharacterized protein n=1 Tax=Spinactinospora alkalitolerans TaxID=687207 RepID=A0A852U4P4_9ACTN|nr:hypothetical protein [Spinactinospora alkalitolerans]NYE50577.1 hypothetical protein [Spinactinospora alkalitolerans]